MKHHSCRFKNVFFLILLFLIIFLAQNTSGSEPQDREYWPTNNWKTSTPEEQGMDPNKLMIADEFVRTRLADAFSLLVVKNGYLVFEKYYSWGDPDKYAVVHSVTKSFISALIGIAIRQHIGPPKIID